MQRRLIIVGAGGFGRETLDVVKALSRTTNAHHNVAVADDAPSDLNLKRLQSLDVPYIGTVGNWLATAHFTDRYTVAIGSPIIRRSVVDRVSDHKLSPATLIHPSANIGMSTHIDVGSIVCAGANISTNVTAGKHVHINSGAIVGHDSTLGSFTSLNPGCVISGGVNIHTGTLIGACSTVLQNLTIGTAVLVGAAACVTKDVPANATAIGIPAKW